MSRMDEFRAFVQKHPLLRDEVNSNKRTWQSIYEEWVLYGEGLDSWKVYEGPLENTSTEPTEKKEKVKKIGMDGVKQVFNNIKKVNPEKLNNTLNSVQKVIQIAQSVTGPKAAAAIAPTVYSDWWD